MASALTSVLIPLLHQLSDMSENRDMNKIAMAPRACVRGMDVDSGVGFWVVPGHGFCFRAQSHMFKATSQSGMLPGPNLIYGQGRSGRASLTAKPTVGSLHRSVSPLNPLVERSHVTTLSCKCSWEL